MYEGKYSISGFMDRMRKIWKRSDKKGRRRGGEEKGKGGGGGESRREDDVRVWRWELPPICPTACDSVVRDHRQQQLNGLAYNVNCMHIIYCFLRD